MLAEIGLFATILAFAIAIGVGPVMIAGYRSFDGRVIMLAQRSAILICAAMVIAFGCLMVAFATSDFSVLTVAQNSHSQKPFIFKLSATWGNHEGSMLLWAMILAFFSGLLAFQARQMPVDIFQRTIGVQLLIIAAFLAFILFTSNPFARISPVPVDGAGLNPLLQDIGLAIHPPFLYLGYVGFSAPFSMAVAALLLERIDNVWGRLVRPWALTAWIFLTIGITLGAWWAYYELGWGGWWAWDPVENASFMPWLAGTALIHSVRVVERRDALKGWAVLLAISAFSLSLVGTFLVRSGVLTSVHAFASDPSRGIFILLILLIATGGALTLYAIRAREFTQTGVFAPVSREGFLVANNLFLTVACATVFVGTFYPLFIDVISRERISVGAPYFNAVFTPLAILTLGFAGVGVLSSWKKMDGGRLIRTALPLVGGATLIGVIALLLLERRALAGAGVSLLVTWLLVSSLADVFRRIGVMKVSFGQSVNRAVNLPRSAWGAMIAHIGLAIFAAGAFGVSLWKTEITSVMEPGESVTIVGRQVTLVSVENAPGANYASERAVFSVDYKKQQFEFAAERRFYPVRRMQTTEAAIKPQGVSDIYATIGENKNGEGWPVRLSFNPAVLLIWWGAGISAFGGVLCLSDLGRRKRAQKPKDIEAQNAGAAISTTPEFAS